MALRIRQRKKYVSHYVLTCSFMVRRDGYWQRNLLYFTFIWQAKKVNDYCQGKNFYADCTELDWIRASSSQTVAGSSRNSLCALGIYDQPYDLPNLTFIGWNSWSPDPFSYKRSGGKKKLFISPTGGPCLHWRHDKRNPHLVQSTWNYYQYLSSYLQPQHSVI